ncbi:hypothetical protein LTR86_007894 [Recurvomyces mirabilis]|nr:hypothetical protein LTR86_007894 [Recurvomyces mirabilis]
MTSTSFKAPLPTTPFDDETEDDPFMLFPEWQHPLSALRHDHPDYIKQQQEADDAEFKKPLQRGTPIDKTELILRILHRGPYATKPPKQPIFATSTTAKRQSAHYTSHCGSPMKLT